MVFVVELPSEAKGFEAQTANSLTVADVIKMVELGLGDDVVVAKIRKEGKSFDLSTDELVALKKASVSNEVVKTMFNPQVTAPQITVASAPAAKAPLDRSADGTVGTRPPQLPDEQGVYVLQRGEWMTVEPQIVNMRTANVLGHAFSYGISKAKVKGEVNGASAKLQITTPVEILIKTADGTAASEYRVLQMEEKNDRREFEMMQIGFASAKSGARKGVVPVSFEKVGRATYKGVLANIKHGEYGVLAPGAAMSASAGSQGKLYSFGITE
jgi:hypothetical protein